MKPQPTSKQLDLSSPEFIANPYPAYQALRESDTPYWLPFYRNDAKTNKNGMWLFSRYDEVKIILQETEKTSVNIKAHLSKSVSTPFEKSMMQLDPPDHTRLRNLVYKYFTPKNLSSLESHIKKTVDECLNNADSQSMEFMHEFAQQVPVKTIAKLLCIPEEDTPDLHRWSIQIANGTDYINSDQNQRKQQEDALKDMHNYFSAWLLDTHQLSKDTISYDLLQTYNTTDLLNKAELLSMLVLLLMAGHGNVSIALGNGLMTLLNHPQQKELLLSNPQYIDTAVDEILRYETPLQRPILRIVTKDFEVGKHTFTPGDNLSVLLGSAHRDPAQFKEPNVFDITRKPNRHLAFGAGIHACLGASLSRMILRTAFTRLFETKTNIRLSSEMIDWRPLTMLRGLQSLPVLF